MQKKLLVSSLVLALGALFVSTSASGRPASSPQDEALASCPAEVPAAVVPATDQRLRFMRAATGVQIYVCNATTTGAHVWQFLAPQANLLNDDDGLAGTHFIGPMWQDNDGSAVKGAKVAGATVDAASIPWLLLKVVASTGDGKMSGITSIQRLDTQGGLAPDASTCTSSTVGTVAQVPYTTEYFFYDTHATNGTNAQCR